MKKLLPDTLFARLFGLVFIALLTSHLLTWLVLRNLPDRRHHEPPPMMNQQEHRPPPPDWRPDQGEPPPPPEHLRTFLLIQLIQFIALALAAWFGSKMIARPIKDLSQGAARLADNLNDPPLAESGPQEAREAARAFNHMQEKVRFQLEARARFLAAVSHDLRTPLTRMKLRLEQPDQTPDTGKLRSDIDEMAAMLDATLQYLRGELQTENWQKLDLMALLETLADNERDNGHHVSINGLVQPIMALPQTLQRCLTNLLENALRYGETAEISVYEQASQVVIEIRDHGPGIPENQMVQVFEPFVRLEQSRNRHTGGVGLGLSIARDAVKRHGGHLTLRNVVGGQGLIASVTLPHKQPQP
ncbi:ATP-binding protein [Ampullimonas aquatilis]|uniref:ATP-binding protein n=1 Tax=Ampullimonas aquatilis TaxID=1341549 RepID=UPI003C779045